MSVFICCFMETLESEWISQEGIIALMSIIVMLLIPIAVLTLNSKQNTFPIDNRIVFKEVFMYKYFIALIIPISISFLFPQIRLLSAIATIVLAIISMRVLYNTFKWLIDDKNGVEVSRQNARIDYLKSLRDESEIINTWSTIMNSNNQFNQTGLMDVFLDSSDYVNNTNKGWNKDIYWGLLRDNYQKFEYDDMKTYKKLIEKTLVYYSERDLCLEEKSVDRNMYKRPSETLRQISQLLLKEALASDASSIKAYLYFDTVERYVKSLSDKRQNLFMNAYLDDFIDGFIKNDVDYRDKWDGAFFDRVTIDSLNMHKHSSDTIMDSYYRNIIIKYVCRNENPSDDIGRRIDLLTQYVFKEVDPILWFQIITFIMWPHPYDEKAEKDARNRIINWCERNRNYGVFGRFDCSIISTPKSDKELRQITLKKEFAKKAKTEQEATLKLLIHFLGLSKFNCGLYIDVIKKLEKEFDKDKLKVEKLKRLRLILEKLIFTIKKTN